jgi:DNA helicase-2/ATP-dependent DNA helicase PcrA
LIAQARSQFAKVLWSDRAAGEKPLLVSLADEAAQAGWVADQVLQQRECGLALKRQAVLFRTSHHSAALELELLRRDIPYVKFGGLKFLEAAHVKDLLSLLRWSQSPRQRIAGFRVALLVAGMGPASARRLLGQIETAADARTALLGFVPPRAAAQSWQALRDALQAIDAAPWPQGFEAALQWYLPQLQRLHAHGEAREADLRQLAQIARGYASREAFLADLTLHPPEASGDEAGAPHHDEDYLVLSTIHSAKGQEWAAVYVLNVVDGCMPSDLGTGSAAEIDEERRLLYVAMTRAQQHLQLLVPQRFHVTQQAPGGDRHLHGLPSRFITPEVASCCDAVSARPPDDEVFDTVPHSGRTVVDVAAALRSIWD